MRPLIWNQVCFALKNGKPKQIFYAYVYPISSDNPHPEGWMSWLEKKIIFVDDIARFQVDSWRQKVTTSIYLTPFEFQSTRMSYTFEIFNQSRNT